MKKAISIFLALSMIFCMSAITLAHGGKTDSSGGHNDNRNVSGLGYYHYHHGYSAHLHPNGVCPYGANTRSNSTSTSTSKSTSKSKSKSTSISAPVTVVPTSATTAVTPTATTKTKTTSTVSSNESQTPYSSAQSPSVITVKAGRRTPMPKFTSLADKTDKEKAEFLDNYIAIVTNTGVYHTIDCEDFTRYKAFTAMDLAKALERDYKPCPKCHS